MKCWLVVVVAFIAIAGCSSREPADAPLAKQAAAAAFPFPSSADFKDLHSGSEAHQVCGLVRGRELNGTMTDYRRFNWRPGSGNLFIEGFGLSAGVSPAVAESMARLNDAMLQIGCTWS